MTSITTPVLDERDAKARRYEWLRDQTINMHFEHLVGARRTSVWHMNARGDESAWLDAYIEEAIAASPKSNGVGS